MIEESDVKPLITLIRKYVREDVKLAIFQAEVQSHLDKYDADGKMSIFNFHTDRLYGNILEFTFLCGQHKAVKILQILRTFKPYLTKENCSYGKEGEGSLMFKALMEYEHASDKGEAENITASSKIMALFTELGATDLGSCPAVIKGKIKEEIMKVYEEITSASSYKDTDDDNLGAADAPLGGGGGGGGDGSGAEAYSTDTLGVCLVDSSKGSL